MADSEVDSRTLAAAMNRTFHFIDGVQPDKASKKLMRSHVMRGKNVGKKLHRQSRLGLQVTQSQQDSKNATSSRYSCENRNQLEHGFAETSSSPIVLARSCENAFLTISLPIDVPFDSLRIINQFFAWTVDKMYPIRLGLSLRDAKYMWLRDLFVDEATHHCSIALMQASNEIFLSDGQSPPKAHYYLAKALSMVRKKLESDSALSNSTITMVASLIGEELMRRQREAAEIHFDGLVKMIKLRGGLHQLEGNISLVLKICKTDILMALQRGGPTVFSRDRMPDVQGIMASGGQSTGHGPLASSDELKQLDLYLLQIFRDVLSICSLFNNLSPRYTLNIQTFLEMIMSICYRLLRFRSLNDSMQQFDVHSAYHVGLIIFVATTVLKFGRDQILDTKLISQCAKQVLECTIDQHENEFVLWFMVVVGIWLSNDVGSEVLTQKIKIITQRLGIRSWDEARSIVSKYPWANALHDELGCSLWNRICSSHQQFVEMKKIDS